jgi:hypothetical protein
LAAIGLFTTFAMIRTALGGMAKSLRLFRQPFDVLAEITAIAVQSVRDGRHHLTKSETLLKGTPMSFALRFVSESKSLAQSNKSPDRATAT